nr:DHA2 family efflux MFS transporter permease subunit [Ktedonobacteraceae bacterium]
MQHAENLSRAPEGARQPSQPLLIVRGRPANPWLVLVALMFGLFMSLLDITIVNIALPNIISKLNTNLTMATWVLNAYSLVFAVLLVTLGRFADQFGRKLIFMCGMVIFSAGSLLCALSPSIEWLIGFRAFQAIGAASLNSVSLAIIMAIFPPRQRGAAIGIWGASSGIASAVGPVLGGFLVQNFDWRWIFFVNLPFCLIGIVMVALFVPETRQIGTSKRIDLPGLLTMSAAMLCLVLGIMQGNAWGWLSAPILALFAASLVSLLLFFIVETRQAEPIVDFSLFKIRDFVSANISMFLFGVAIQGAFLIMVLYFINDRGYDQLGAAYAILPIPLASFVTSIFSGIFSRRLNQRVMGFLGLVLLSLGLGLLYTLTPDASYLDTAWRSVLIGVGMGLCFQNFPNFALAGVPRAKLGVGSGVFNTFRQIGFTLGVAVLIAVFTNQVQANVDLARIHSVQFAQSDTRLPPQLRDGIANGLRQAKTDANSSGQAPNANSFDLTRLADRIPGPAGQALKPELQSLQN